MELNGCLETIEEDYVVVALNLLIEPAPSLQGGNVSISGRAP